MEIKSKTVAFFPRIPIRTDSEVILVAGPTSKKTRAVPGLTPFRIKDAAIGVDAVAHI